MSANDHKAERLGEMGGRELLEAYDDLEWKTFPVSLMTQSYTHF